MANNFVVTDYLAPIALKILQGRLLAGMLFDNKYLPEFKNQGYKIGDKIRIKRRGFGGVVDIIRGQDISFQNVTETETYITLDKHFGYAISYDDKDNTFYLNQANESLSNFNFDDVVFNQLSSIVAPAAHSLAENIESRTLNLVNDIPNVYLENDVLPSSLPNSLSELQAINLILDRNKVSPMNRFAIVNAEYFGEIGLSSFSKVNESGTSNFLLNADVNRVLGFDIYKSLYLGNNELFADHVSGSIKAMTLNGNFDIGATILNFNNAGTLDGTLKAGDTLRISTADGKGYFVVVAQDATASGGILNNVLIKEPLRIGLSDTSAVINAGVEVEGSPVIYRVVGFFGVRDAVSFLSLNPANSSIPGVINSSVSMNGFSVKLELARNINQVEDKMLASSLFGGDVLDGSLGVKILQRVG